MDRKTFITTLGVGAGGCMCGAVLAARAAFGDEPAGPAPKSGEPAAPPPPGEKSVARAAKRMEFVDVWVPRFFAVMDDALDEPTRRRLMAANGKACFSAFRPDLKRRSRPATPEEIAELVATRGKANGWSMEGDTLYLEYTGSAETGGPAPAEVCLCPVAEGQPPKRLSPTFCWCSLGYVKEMHERLLGRPVEVELLEAVLLGQPRCRFRITLA